MKIFLKKISCLLAIVILLVCIIPFILLAGIISFINVPLSIKITTIWVYMVWYLLGCIFRMSYKLTGKNVLKHKTNYIVLSNHIGSLDFMVINELFRERGMLGHLKYIIKSELKIIPIFYQTVCLLYFLILKRNYEADKPRIIEYLKKMSFHRTPACIILYPEGGRFTEQKKIKSWEYCEKTGNSKFNHVLFPRTKGFELIGSNIDTDYIKEVADITLIHKGKHVPALWQVLLTEIKDEIEFHIKITAIKDIKDFRGFVIDSFKEKDLMIGERRKFV